MNNTIEYNIHTECINKTVKVLIDLVLFPTVIAKLQFDAPIEVTTIKLFNRYKNKASWTYRQPTTYVSFKTKVFLPNFNTTLLANRM